MHTSSSLQGLGIISLSTDSSGTTCSNKSTITFVCAFIGFFFFREFASDSFLKLIITPQSYSKSFAFIYKNKSN